MLFASISPRAFREHWARIDEEAAGERAAYAGFDTGPLVVFVVGALSLVLMEYAGVPDVLSALLDHYEARHPGTLWGASGLYAWRFWPLIELAWWVAFRILGFFVIPALAIRLLLRERVRDHGLSTRDLRPHLGAYLALLALVVPCLVAASFQRDFVRYYPFYKRAHESVLDLALWEALYAAHFVALEFFFRGFWLTACRRALGSHAIFAAMVPYCMIHFTKPVLEVLAAIAAGVVLGTLAMRARSIWGGALLHIAVALTMDLLALARGPGLPARLLP